MASIKYMNEVLKLYGWKVKAEPSIQREWSNNGLIERKLRDWYLSRVGDEDWLTIHRYVSRRTITNEEILAGILTYELPRLEIYARTSEKIARHLINLTTQNLI